MIKALNSKYGKNLGDPTTSSGSKMDDYGDDIHIHICVCVCVQFKKKMCLGSMDVYLSKYTEKLKNIHFLGHGRFNKTF